MKRNLVLAIILVSVSVLISIPAVAEYFTTNTFNTAWTGTTTIAAGVGQYSQTADPVQTSGAQYVIYTLTNGGAVSQPNVTCEAIWLYNTGTTAVTRETLAIQTATQVKSSRAYFRLYNNSSTSAVTPEAYIYGY